MERNKYVYDGPVKEFDLVVQDNWHGETWAESVKKAKNNLAYQWRMAHNRVAGSRVTLPGTLKKVS